MVQNRKSSNRARHLKNFSHHHQAHTSGTSTSAIQRSSAAPLNTPRRSNSFDSSTTPNSRSPQWIHESKRKTNESAIRTKKRQSTRRTNKRIKKTPTKNTGTEPKDRTGNSRPKPGQEGSSPLDATRSSTLIINLHQRDKHSQQKPEGDNASRG